MFVSSQVCRAAKCLNDFVLHGLGIAWLNLIYIFFFHKVVLFSAHFIFMIIFNTIFQMLQKKEIITFFEHEAWLFSVSRTDPSPGRISFPPTCQFGLIYYFSLLPVVSIVFALVYYFIYLVCTRFLYCREDKQKREEGTQTVFLTKDIYYGLLSFIIYNGFSLLSSVYVFLGYLS